MIKRTEVQAIFGENAFEHGIFYLHEGSLRFELSVSGGPIEMFDCALNKAKDLCEEIFDEGAPIGVCLSFYGGRNFLSALSFFKELSDIGISIPKSSECWRVRDTEEDNLYRHFILYEVPHSSLISLLWGALAQDLGVRPRIKGDTYIFSPSKRVLVHPYDDRGMDIICPESHQLTGLYQKYNSWILDYDRDTMDKVHSGF